MGSGMEYMDPSNEGILPRAIMHIFQRCGSYEREAELKGNVPTKCTVSCQFIEVKSYLNIFWKLISNILLIRFITKIFMTYSIKKITIIARKNMLINTWYSKIAMGK